MYLFWPIIIDPRLGVCDSEQPGLSNSLSGKVDLSQSSWAAQNEMNEFFRVPI